MRSFKERLAAQQEGPEVKRQKTEGGWEEVGASGEGVWQEVGPPAAGGWQSVQLPVKQASTSILDILRILIGGICTGNLDPGQKGRGDWEMGEGRGVLGKWYRSSRAQLVYAVLFMAWQVLEDA